MFKKDAHFEIPSNWSQLKRQGNSIRSTFVVTEENGDV